jgi:acyl dehydratase
MARVYLRALFQRKGHLDEDGEVPEMRARLRAQTLDRDHLEAYREACGAEADVPVGYPQLLITPVHVALLTDRNFPIRAMGLIHPRFSITQHRPLRPGEPLAFECWFDGTRAVRNGIEFDIETRAFVDDELVWESTAATFHRTGNEKGPSRPVEESWETRQQFEVPADAGRRYARVSGDANPVHLHPLTSRLFGFKQPIAHGWWLVARCLAELAIDGPESGEYQFEFRRPVFLGRSYTLASSRSDDEVGFAVIDDREKLRLKGRAQLNG